MNVVLYARVSSDRQDVDLSITAQLKAMRDYAEKHGHRIVKEYIDEAESGRSIDRPGFKEMIAAARQKAAPFQGVLVWKLSRFARNREDSIIYKSLLRKHGIQVFSINEPLEDTPSGRLLEGIIEVIDEFYSANLAQDVVRGMRENTSRGFFGGGNVPFGYRRVTAMDGERARTKLEPNPATAPIVERIFKEALSEEGLKDIAVALNRDGLVTPQGKQWGPQSVYNILHNEAYTGTLVWDRQKKRRTARGESYPPVRVENAWPTIVDRASFDRVQARMALRAPRMMHPMVVQSRYLLSGLIKCGECDVAMTGMIAKSGQFFYYACNNSRRKGKMCQTPLKPKQKIESFVIDRIKENILTRENLEAIVRMTNAEAGESRQQDEERVRLLDEQIADTEGRLVKLYDALETGSFEPTQLAPRMKSLQDKKAQLEVAREEAQAKLWSEELRLPDPEVVSKQVSDLRTLLETSSIMEQRAVLRSFVQRVEVTKDEVRVVYVPPVSAALKRNGLTEEDGVLPVIEVGSPGRIRTYDLAVNSRSLYR